MTENVDLFPECVDSFLEKVDLCLYISVYGYRTASYDCSSQTGWKQKSI